MVVDKETLDGGRFRALQLFQTGPEFQKIRLCSAEIPFSGEVTAA